MNRLRLGSKHVALLLLGGVVAAAGARELIETRNRVTRLERTLRQGTEELARLAHATPTPTPSNSALLREDVKAAEKRLAGLRAVLSRAPEGGRQPGRPREMYLALAEWKRDLREQARKSQVRVPPGEEFGFAAYTHDSPGAAHLEAVHRQMIRLRPVLECLFQARPAELLGVLRERPMVKGPAENDSGAEDEHYRPPASLDLRVPGLVEADLFRIEFTGETSALRKFLNAMAEHPVPYVVRSVEVEPLPGNAPSAEGKPTPLVEQHLSRFTVVVAAIELTEMEVNP